MSTASQDTYRQMQEVLAHMDENNHLGAWAEGPVSDVQDEFVEYLISKCEHNMCPHVEDTAPGELQVFMHAALESIICVECFKDLHGMEVPAEYLESDNCDWCERETIMFNEIIMAFPNIAFTVTANVCDSCERRLKAGDR